MESIGEILKKENKKSLISTKISSNVRRPERNPGIGRPDCPICNGLGYVIPDVPLTDPSFGRAVTCSCRAVDEEMTRMDRLMRLSQLGALKNSTFETFLPEGHGLTQIRQRNLRMAYDYALSFAEKPEGWLILKGGYGCGKTHLAAAIANQQLNMGHPVLFINTPDLLDHLRSTFSPNSDIGYDSLFDRVRNAPLLILDDLGSQSNTEWAQEKLYQIFNHRYINRLPTVVTTNLEIEALDERIQSRLLDPDLANTTHIAAPDFRQAGTPNKQYALSSLDLHYDQTFERFDLRTHGTPRSQVENLRRAYEAALAFAHQPTDWLVFNSTIYGNGKTHLAAAIANFVSKNGESVLFIVVPDLLDHLRATFNPKSGVRLDKRFDEVKTAPLLVLDDLGTESATPWAREKLYQLFNYRYNARLPTVITTATPIEELDPKLATRILDGRRCTFFLIEAESYQGGGQSRRKGS